MDKTFDESCLVNSLIAFKTANTYKQLSIVSDLEEILAKNVNKLNLESVAQFLYCYARLQQDEGKKNAKLLEHLKYRACKKVH